MRTRTPFAVIMAAVAIGCGSDGPPIVRYGREACSHCRMIVNDDRFAAAARTLAGDSLKFDDVCCLIDHQAAGPERVARMWVRGYQTGKWLDADAAFFVHGPKLQTPMGSGMAAAATRSDADALAKEWGGRVLRFHELKAFLDAKNDWSKGDCCHEKTKRTDNPSSEVPK